MIRVFSLIGLLAMAVSVSADIPVCKDGACYTFVPCADCSTGWQLKVERNSKSYILIDNENTGFVREPSFYPDIAAFGDVVLLTPKVPRNEMIFVLKFSDKSDKVEKMAELDVDRAVVNKSGFRWAFTFHVGRLNRADALGVIDIASDDPRPSIVFPEACWKNQSITCNSGPNDNSYDDYFVWNDSGDALGFIRYSGGTEKAIRMDFSRHWSEPHWISRRVPGNLNTGYQSVTWSKNNELVLTIPGLNVKSTYIKFDDSDDDDHGNKWSK